MEKKKIQRLSRPAANLGLVKEEQLREENGRIAFLIARDGRAEAVLALKRMRTAYLNAMKLQKKTGRFGYAKSSEYYPGFLGSLLAFRAFLKGCSASS